MTSSSFHIQCLKRELDVRKLRNPRYSLRAFARALNVHPSALSRVLRGSQPLSLKSASEFLRKIPLAPEDRIQFAASVANELFLETRNQVRRFFEEESNSSHFWSLLQPMTSESHAPALDQNLYREIAEFMPQPTWVATHEGRIVLVNRALSQQTGALIDAHSSDRLTALTFLHPEDGAIFQWEWEIAKRSTKPFQLKCRLKDLNDQYHAYMIRTMPLKDEHGQVIGWLSTAYELSASGVLQDKLPTTK